MTRTHSSPARVGLHVYSPFRRVKTVCVKCTRLAKILNPVDVLVAAIVSGPRLSLGILIGQAGSECLDNG